MRALRDELSGTRAAGLLLQLALRCLSRLWRTGHDDGGQRGASARRSLLVRAAGSRDPLGRAGGTPQALTDPWPGGGIRVRSQDSLARPSGTGKGRDPAGLRPDEDQVPVQDGEDDRELRGRLGRRRLKRGASLQGDHVGPRADPARAVHVPSDLRCMPWFEIGPLRPGGTGRWAPHQRRCRPADRGGARLPGLGAGAGCSDAVGRRAGARRSAAPAGCRPPF